MKIQIHEAVKDYIRGELLITRSLLNICQEEMAHRLLMSTRAYVSLEGLLAIMDSVELNIR